MAVEGGRKDPLRDWDGETRPAEHIAAMARALVLMGPMATGVTTRQAVSVDQAQAITALLPALVERHGLSAQVEVDGDLLTVSFALEREATA